MSDTGDAGLQLHGFFNSSASYRVRIALALKGLGWQHVGVNIRRGDQNQPQFRARNANGLVPTLERQSGGGAMHLSQSLAIIDRLERIQPEPRLIPLEDDARDRVLEIALLIACDIHPLNNMRVLKQLTGPFGLTEAQKLAWYAHWIEAGFDALEALLSEEGAYCVGTAVSLADCCLVPQVANATRMGIDLSRWPRVLRIYAACSALPAFRAAAPEVQPDYVAA
jgi:maleylacetoacetate isomerase